jgi:2-hydroxychromene-2-carboxylate isomerase
VLLGGVYKLTGNRSPAESLAGIKNKPDYERLETARFIKRHGITSFRQNPFLPVNTLTIMRGAIAAQRLDVFEHYVDEIYRHMWSELEKLDDPAVLRAALLESGFEADRFAELVQDAEVKVRLLDNTERSVARGTFGSPTLLCRRQDLFRQRPAARCRGNDTGDAIAGGNPMSGAGLFFPCRPGEGREPSISKLRFFKIRQCFMNPARFVPQQLRPGLRRG